LKFSVKAGRGLCYKTVKVFKNIDEIDEFSIGHSIISRAVLIGMRAAVADMRTLVSAL
jgi:pyridoxine 5-phosphate synthase